MDPTKWAPFNKLTQQTQDRISTVYPYLKLDQCLFQDKASGVFMKQVNNVKIEKLLDIERPGVTPPPPPTPPAPQTTTTTRTSATGRRTTRG